MSKRAPFPTGTDAASVAERLRMVREAMGMTSGDFARQAGISVSGYSQYETAERRCSLEAGIRLAHRYGLTLDWIFMGDHTSLSASLVDAMNATRVHRSRVAER